MTFNDVVKFHGHACPGLALGYRAATLAMRELGIARANDEELVAIVENDSCAADAIQVVTGCTFGKGNFIFRDYGKQVYTIARRSNGETVRISLTWEGPPESRKETEAWEKYGKGDRSEYVIQAVRNRKQRRMQAILDAGDEELFSVTRPQIPLPEPARIHPSLRCSLCGEKVMETRVIWKEGRPLCIPCAGKQS